MREWNTQFNGKSFRLQEVNSLVESAFYVPDERTTIQDFINEYMINGHSPIEVQLHGIANDIPEPIDIYPSVTQSFNMIGRYDADDDYGLSMKSPQNKSIDPSDSE